MVVGSKDFKVRLFDLSSGKLAQDIQNEVDGHVNRVFCTKLDPQNPHILFSGSWDSYVLINDLRKREAVGNFQGPYVCGESIDVRGNSILVGSYRSDNYLNVYDLRTFERAESLAWGGQGGGFIYSSRWWQCKDVKSDVLVAGSSNSNDIKVFKKRNQDEQEESKEGESSFFEINHISNTSGGVLCMDISPDNSSLAYGTQGGELTMVLGDGFNKEQRRDDDEDDN